jgi:hypothetical protein
MTRRHRLTVETDQPLQPARHARLRIRKLDPLRANAALAAADATLVVHHRDRMRGPGQVLPGPLFHIAHAAGAPATATARVPANPASLDADPERAVRGVTVTVYAHHPESRQAENPGTLSSRFHASSLVDCTSREDNTGWSGVSGIVVRPVRRAPAATATHRLRGGAVKPEAPLVLQAFASCALAISKAKSPSVTLRNARAWPWPARRRRGSCRATPRVRPPAVVPHMRKMRGCARDSFAACPARLLPAAGPHRY